MDLGFRLRSGCRPIQRELAPVGRQGGAQQLHVAIPKFLRVALTVVWVLELRTFSVTTSKVWSRAVGVMSRRLVGDCPEPGLVTDSAGE